jgi:predicted double-glycine peptidase
MAWTVCWPLLAAMVCLATTAHAREEGEPIRDPQHTFQQHVDSWWELRQRNVVMQKRDYSCGVAALATVIRYHWQGEVTESLLLRELDAMLTAEEAVDRIKNGLTMTDLRRLSERLGYQASMVRVDFNQLTQVRIPVVLALRIRDYDHFAAFRGTANGYVYLADPARGNTRTPDWEFTGQWKDGAILAVVRPGVAVRESSPLSIRRDETLVGGLHGTLIRKNYLEFHAASPVAGP